MADINSESDVAASIQIGPTTEGMVRIFVEGDGFGLPIDFDPEEAEEIAEELRGAAERARAVQGQARKGGAPKGKGGPAGGRGPKGRPGR
ncbi:hypothetical protein SAMN05444336_102127 [Albimonas donghaensis]|uniref:Uncharacterized protein n=1 Tax=Albimonas donghaensis TaxID=356660 RepID=A0A1H2VNL2_9RHOB|nr:DUF6324 family protein [Albimonas donghaensis]MAS42550.1 hypothetical protein [Paracoccaceae bacterium]MBR29382.1 hypothetical protein [Paracoccaceae bacterium]SDW69952.1 hypothetical protein SAMN05444336_102127 [Albimonas donghaensis]